VIEVVRVLPYYGREEYVYESSREQVVLVAWQLKGGWRLARGGGDRMVIVMVMAMVVAASNRTVVAMVAR
jgi:hypothetical protein